MSSKSVKGVSLKMIEMYITVFACRLASILFYEGYLPFDSSGDYLYRGMEIAGFFMCLTIALCTITMFKDTYESSADSFGKTIYKYRVYVLAFNNVYVFIFIPSLTNPLSIFLSSFNSGHILGVPSFMGIIWVVAPSFVLALIFHPSLNSNMLTDVSWTFALALESTAILPQIIMYIKSLKDAQKKGIEAGNEGWVSHILACLGLARLIHLVFWLSSYTELNDKFNSSPGGSHVGHFVVFSQCVQLLLMCDYLYYYVKALYSGGNISSELQNNWASSGKSADEFA